MNYLLKGDLILISQLAEIAQSVEQGTENPCVGGSIPPLGTIYIMIKYIFIFTFISVVSITTVVYANESIKVYDEIPKSQNNNLVLYYPQSNQIIHKNKFLIKGINRYNTPVLVNGREIEVFPDGRFFVHHEMTSLNQDLFITFILPTKEKVTIYRKIKRLDQPENMNIISNENKKPFIGFYNSGLINKERFSSASDVVSRADLAFFIDSINVEKPRQLVNVDVMTDVNKDYWAALSIKNSLENRWMSEFPDATFKPENNVNRLEYVLTLIKRFELTLVTKNVNLFQDIQSSWVSKYVNTAYDNELIPSMNNFSSKTPIRLVDLFLFTKNLQEIKLRLENILSFDKGFQKVDLVLNDRGETYLKDANQNKVNAVKITLNSSKKIVLGKELKVSGSVSPPSVLLVDEMIVTPNQNGYFECLVTKDYGVQQVVISARGSFIKEQYVFLKEYSDMGTHWAHETSAKMRFLGMSYDSNTFNPNKLITKIEFVRLMFKIINKFNRISYSDIEVKELIFDIGSESDQKIISYFLQNKVLLLNSGNFFPNKILSRAEVITMIVRIFDLKNKNTNDLNIKDIKRHWAKEYVKAAVDNQLLSNKERFYPKKAITNAELITVISRVPEVKDVLNNEL